MMIVVPPGVPKRVSAQKYGDAPDTLQAGRSERSQPEDLLGFNTGPVDPKKSQRRTSQFDLQLIRRESFISNLGWNMPVLPKQFQVCCFESSQIEKSTR